MTLELLIGLIPHTHVFYCVKGMHYGVIPYPTQLCPLGCNG